jgi:acyl carrier protein
MQTEIERDLRRFVAANFLFGQKETLRPDDSFLEKGILDSTGILELVTYLEETYTFQVDGEELTPENFDSIARLTKFIEYKTNGEASPSALDGAQGAKISSGTEEKLAFSRVEF